MKVGMKPGNECLPSEGIDDYECATCFDLSLRCIDCNGDPLRANIAKRRSYLSGARKRAANMAGPSDIPRGVHVDASGVLRALGTFAWIVVGVVLLSLAGCGGTFAQSKATCLGAVDTHQEAIALVVPHLTEAMTCAANNVHDDEAAIACVHAQFEKMREHTKPIVYACALTLIGDVVTAGKK